MSTPLSPPPEPTALQHRYAAERAKVELARIAAEVEIAKSIVLEDRDARPYRDAIVAAQEALHRAAMAAEDRAAAAEKFEAARSGAA